MMNKLLSGGAKKPHQQIYDQIDATEQAMFKLSTPIAK